MRQLLTRGEFASIPFGSTREEVIQKLGELDATLPVSRRNPTPVLLRWGDVELIFDQDCGLFWCFLWEPSDDDLPLCNDRVTIDPWVLGGGMTYEMMQNGLSQAGIAFACDTGVKGEYRLTLESGVVLRFEDGGDDNDTGFRLRVVSADRREVIPPSEPKRQVSVTLTKAEFDRLRRAADLRKVSAGRLCVE